jgi:signal transduction histidine kinase
MANPKASRSRSETLLLTRVWVGAACLLMILVFALSTWRSYRAAQEGAEVEATRQAALLANQIGRSIGVLDRALLIVRQRVQQHGMAFFGTDEGSLLLRDLAQAMPLDTTFWVFQPNGIAIGASSDLKGRTIDIADRDYFKLLAGKGDHAVVFGDPVIGKTSNADIIPIARPVRVADGELAGIVMASLRLASVNDAYRGFLSNGLNSITLKRLEYGKFIFEIPPLDGIGDDLAERVRNSSPLEAKGKTYAAREVEGYPLLAIAGVHSLPWRQRWRNETLVQAVWLSIGLGLSAFIYVAMGRRVRADEAYKRRLELSDAAKSHFLAAASHDLRQPIQAMRLYWEVLASAEATRTQPAIAGMGEAIGAAEGLLETLLHFSLLESGLIEPQVEMVHLGELIGQVCAPLHRDAEARGLKIVTVASSLQVLTDRALLAQILSNLISNAVK